MNTKLKGKKLDVAQLGKAIVDQMTAKPPPRKPKSAKKRPVRKAASKAR